MIVEALLEADPVYGISQTITDPAAYLHLTDDIIQRIERSKDEVRGPCLFKVHCSHVVLATGEGT